MLGELFSKLQGSFPYARLLTLETNYAGGDCESAEDETEFSKSFLLAKINCRNFLVIFDCG